MNEEINTSSNDDNLYLTVKVGGQPFGIPVHCVHDVSKAQKITQVPLAPPEVAGALNLRGRIVTVINVGKKLGLKDTGNDASTIYMYVVIEHEGELYSLMVDSVGDVMSQVPRVLSKIHPIWSQAGGTFLPVYIGLMVNCWCCWISSVSLRGAVLSLQPDKVKQYLITKS